MLILSVPLRSDDQEHDRVIRIQSSPAQGFRWTARFSPPAHFDAVRKIFNEIMDPWL